LANETAERAVLRVFPDPLEGANFVGFLVIRERERERLALEDIFTVLAQLAHVDLTVGTRIYVRMRMRMG